MSAPLDELVEYLRETGVLSSVRSLLSWDQETFMPAGGAELRAGQLALLAGQIHRRVGAPRFRDLIDGAAATTDGEDSPGAAIVREARRDHDYATRLPVEIVEELARTSTLARRAWVDARARDDFKSFQPWLEKILDLNRRKAEALGYEESAYDALLDRFEPGETAARIQALFDPLRDAHVDLLQRLRDAGRPPESGFLRGAYPTDGQDVFAREVAAALGFDFERGRLDLAVHPFCSGTGPSDVRMTTRYDEGFFADGLFSVIHEAGHGIYEQGLDEEEFGTPLGQSVSFGIHESQSRLWENLVGRSRGFWRHFFPRVRELFPERLAGIEAEDFYRAINEVEPGFIRVDADEVTYNLHIFLRSELEQALLAGDLTVADLPGAWNERFEASFGRRPPTDREGCLQDIHWAMGTLGYFPTYTLGNVYAAQIFERARAELGDLDAAFARGEFEPLRRWLNEKIHAQGRRHPPRRLLELVTGAPPSPEPLVRHLETKFTEIYGAASGGAANS